MDIEDVKKMMLEEMQNSAEPVIPEALNDERLEDAFKVPVCDENGYAPTMPGILNSCSYGMGDDGVKIISLRSACSASGLYSKYLDEHAVVWDAAKQELFLYIPDIKCPTVAFKGGSWLCAKRLKSECNNLNIYDVYKEIQSKIKEELSLQNN